MTWRDTARMARQTSALLLEVRRAFREAESWDTSALLARVMESIPVHAALTARRYRRDFMRQYRGGKTTPFREYPVLTQIETGRRILLVNKLRFLKHHGYIEKHGDRWIAVPRMVPRSSWQGGARADWRDA